MRSGLLALLWAASGIAAAQTVAVGSSAGTFDVTSAGASTYAMPIVAPPGVAGIEPKLSVAFSSNGGDGFLGLRFALSGLSLVTRCGSTIAQDGSARPVLLDAGDRYCLDGQRLVTTAAYGSIGARYRTEIESFSDVASSGGAAGNPGTWVVRTKAGLTLTYGTTPTNCATPATNTVTHVPTGMRRAWLLSRVQDTSGNWMDYCYAFDAASAESYLTEIRYTGNDNAGLTPFASVVVSYRSYIGARPEGYYRGHFFQRTRLVDKIRTQTGSTPLREYRFSYITSGLGPRAQLSQIQECAGATLGECLRPTKFTWHSFQEEFESPVSEAMSGDMAGAGELVGDWDADGRQDLVVVKLTSDRRPDPLVMSRGLSAGTGSFSSYPAGPRTPLGGMTYPGTTAKFLLGDVNGDSRLDLVALDTRVCSTPEYPRPQAFQYAASYLASAALGSKAFGEAVITRLNDQAYSPNCPNVAASSVLPMPPIATEKAVTDIDGDGKADVIWAGSNSVNGTLAQAFLSLGNGSFTPKATQILGIPVQAGTATKQSRRTLIGDVNGDHRADVVTWLWTGNQLDVSSHLGVGDGTFRTPTNQRIQIDTNQGQERVLLTDMTGDGNADIVLTSSSSTIVANVIISQGNGLFETFPGDGMRWVHYNIAQTTGAFDSWEPLVGDYNGDGRLDLLMHDRGNRSGLDAVIGYSKSDGTWHLSAELRLLPSAMSGYDLQSGDFNGDGESDLAFYNENSSGQRAIRYFEARAGMPGWLASIESGLGSRIEIDYAALTSAVYSRSVEGPRGCGGYPVSILCSALKVTATVRSTNPGYPKRVSNYAYDTGVVDVSGRGFLGFAQVSVQSQTPEFENDDQRKITEVRRYLRNISDADFLSRFWEAGQLLSSYINDGYFTYPLSRVDVALEGRAVLASSPRSIAVLPKTRTERYFDPGTFTPFRSRTIDTYYEEPAGSATFFGNATRVVERTYSGDVTGTYFETQTVNSYSNNTAGWLLGRLDAADVTRTTPSGESATRRSRFAYHAVTGLLSEETIEPSSIFELKTVYGRDGFGNVTSKTVSGAVSTRPDDVARVETQQFSAAAPFYGRYVTRLCNALNQCANISAYDGHGNARTVTDANNLITTYGYDAWGRSASRNFSQAGVSQTQTVTRAYCGAGACDSGAAFEVVEIDNAGGYVRRMFDVLEREVASYTRAGGGGTIRNATTYLPEGYVGARSAPRLTGTGTASWSTYLYDKLGRVVESKDAAGKATTVDYQGLISVETDPLQHRTTRETDALGNLIRVTDAAGGNVRYEYDPYQNLRSTTDPAGSLMSMSYDIRGRKIGMTDTSLGAWEYRYNNFGELIWQKDAKAQIINFGYDKLGRMISRAEAEGTTAWAYDYEPGTSTRRWIGGLTQVEQKTTGGVLKYKRSHGYLPHGRVASDTIEIAGSGIFSYGYGYDSFGRPEKLTYPSGLQIQNHYNAYGFVDNVHRAGDANTAFSYWKALSWDDFNATLENRYGNGIVNAVYRDPNTGRIDAITSGPSGNGSIQTLNYVWDSAGNLHQREDARRGIVETTTYDALDRLKTVSLSTPWTTKTTMEVQYTANGNGNILFKTGSGSYDYFAGRPQLLKTSTQNGIATSYTYDANGNMATRTGGSVTWSSFNLPLRIVQNGAQVDFTYGPERQRITQTTASKAITYVDALYEVVNGTKKQYIPTPDGVIGFESQTGTNPGVVTYWHKDHLGSLDMVTNQAGTIIEDPKYDAFGRLQTWHREGWAYAAPGNSTNYGFTGHEMLNEVGLVHMNGRVYDPTLGRFISADPTVPVPDNSQSFNRYSYAINNPLRYNDPSGYKFGLGDIGDFFDDAVDGLFDGIGNIGAQVLGIAAAAVAVACECFDPSTAYSIGVSVGNFAFQGNYSGGDNRQPSMYNLVGAGYLSQLAQASVQHGTGPPRPVPSATASQLTVGGTASDIGDGKFSNGAAGEIFQFALGLIPGYDLAQAILNPEAIAGDYILGALSVIPAGKAAALGVKAGTKILSKVASIGALRYRKLKDAHHIIQDASVRDLPGYSTSRAPGVQLPGPSTKVGSPHYEATRVQEQAGGGTYGAERRIGYKALRKAGLSADDARDAIRRADEYFETLGVTRSTPTRIPDTRP